MSLEVWIAIGCLVGFVILGTLYRSASSRAWYRDVEGDGVSARSVCGYAALICLAVLLGLAVRWLGF